MKNRVEQIFRANKFTPNVKKDDHDPILFIDPSIISCAKNLGCHFTLILSYFVKDYNYFYDNGLDLTFLLNVFKIHK